MGARRQLVARRAAHPVLGDRNLSCQNAAYVHSGVELYWMNANGSSTTKIWTPWNVGLGFVGSSWQPCAAVTLTCVPVPPADTDGDGVPDPVRRVPHRRGAGEQQRLPGTRPRRMPTATASRTLPTPARRSRGRRATMAAPSSRLPRTPTAMASRTQPTHARRCRARPRTRAAPSYPPLRQGSVTASTARTCWATTCPTKAQPLPQQRHHVRRVDARGREQGLHPPRVGPRGG